MDIFVEGKIIVIHMVLLLDSSHEAISLSLASSSSGVGFGSSRERHPLDVAAIQLQPITVAISKYEVDEGSRFSIRFR